MKPYSFIPLFAALAVLCAGCSSTPTKVNTGAIRARTFNFVVKSNPPSFTDNTGSVHKMIQDSITQNLASRGVTRVASGGDVTVRYLIIKGDNVSTTAIDDYFGYSDDENALHVKAHDAYTRGKNPNDFEAGTLLIDIVDGKTFKLLSRGYATRTLLQNPSPAERAARIQGVVNEILSQIRIAK